MRIEDLKIGDVVSIFKKVIPYNWKNIWTSNMDNYIGKQGTVLSIDKLSGVCIKFTKNDFYFPIESLKIVGFEHKKIQDI